MNLIEFSVANRARCEAENGFNHKMSDWSLSDWMTATLGELGEAANVLKKLNRYRDGLGHLNKESESDLRLFFGKELADAFIYLDLMAQAAGLSLHEIVPAKFAETSAKIGYEPVK